MKNKYIYVIQQIDIIEGQPVSGIVIGAYTNRRMASKAVTELRSKEKNKGKVMYDLITVQANTVPVSTDEYEQALYDLIDKGLMEPLVGEDGYFHYTLTEEGKRRASEIINRLENEDEDELGGEEGID